MNRLYGSILLSLCWVQTLGQITFDQFPRDLQLYPRNASNQADMPVSGRITEVGWSKISVQVLREGKLIQQVGQALSPTATNTPFQFSGQIKAEPAEYAVKVFLYKNNDSTLIASRTRIVCGDVYIIHGQSNALALPGMDEYYGWGFDDKYLRNCDYPYGFPDIPAGMQWYTAKQPYAHVGGFGLTLQRLILQTYGIPTAVINGAVGGSDIVTLSARNPANPADLATPYGQLLFRTQWAGVARQVKGIIWKQGEYEAGSGYNLANYAALFKTLYDQFRRDYNPDARMYVSQNNILGGDITVPGAAGLRDVQRRFRYQYANLETIATLSSPQYDGIHYGPLGHQQMAREQFRQLARDIYGSTDTLQINSPDIKKVVLNARKDSLTLIFDEGMRMVYQTDTTLINPATGGKSVKRMIDYFYLDGQAGSVTGGLARDNRVILSLNQPTTAKALRYLPTSFLDGPSGFYDGPTLKNGRGMRAFTFDNMPIGEAIPAISTLAAKSSAGQIQLSWTAPPTATAQYLERADNTPATYRRIATLSGTATTYTDAALPSSTGTYYYRLRAVSAVSESAYSNVVQAQPMVILALDPLLAPLRLFPNPVAPGGTLSVSPQPGVSVLGLRLTDVQGRAVFVQTGPGPDWLLPTLATGRYLADVTLANGSVVRLPVLVH